MKKTVLLFFVALFMAVPVMAVSNVTITCVDDDVNMVTVSYASDFNRIRAFGLDITVDGNTIIAVSDVCDYYRIFPGQIDFVEGDVNDYGLCYDPCDIGDANLTVEMGSLYTTDPCYASDPNAGYNMQPALSGTLFKFYTGGDCTYTVDVNGRRGGIVMEDPYETPSLDSPLCSGAITSDTDCYVPNVDNMPPEQANQAIIAANLVPGPNTCTASCTAAYDFNVVSTTPPYDTLVTCGSTVSKTICECYCDESDYSEWEAAGKPECWCWPRQCYGDADGKTQGKSPNIYWVASNDLTILKTNWQVVDPPTGAGRCADFDHKPQGKSPNIYRVASNDLTILKTNWQIVDGPAAGCSPGNR